MTSSTAIKHRTGHQNAAALPEEPIPLIPVVCVRPPFVLHAGSTAPSLRTQVRAYICHPANTDLHEPLHQLELSLLDMVVVCSNHRQVPFTTAIVQVYHFWSLRMRTAALVLLALESGELIQYQTILRRWKEFVEAYSGSDEGNERNVRMWEDAERVVEAAIEAWRVKMLGEGTEREEEAPEDGMSGF